MKRLFIALFLLLSVIALACDDNPCGVCGAGLDSWGNCPNANTTCHECGADLRHGTNSCPNSKYCYYHGEYHGDSCPNTRDCDRGHTHACSEVGDGMQMDFPDGFTGAGPNDAANHTMLYWCQDMTEEMYSNCPDYEAVGFGKYYAPVLPYCTICKSTIKQELFENWKKQNDANELYEYGIKIPIEYVSENKHGGYIENYDIIISKINRGSIDCKFPKCKIYETLKPSYWASSILSSYKIIEDDSSPSGYSAKYASWFIGVDIIKHLTIIPLDIRKLHDITPRDENHDFLPIFQADLEWYYNPDSNLTSLTGNSVGLKFDGYNYEEALALFFEYAKCENDTTCSICRRAYHNYNGCPNQDSVCAVCGETTHNESLSCQNTTCSEYKDSVECSDCGAYYVGSCYNSELRCACGESMHNPSKSCKYENDVCSDCGESTHNVNHACWWLGKTCEICAKPLKHDSTHSCPHAEDKCSYCQESIHNRTLSCTDESCPAYSITVKDMVEDKNYIILKNSPISFSIPSQYNPSLHSIVLEYTTSEDLASAVFDSVITIDNYQPLNGREAYHFGQTPLKNIDVADDTIITVRAKIIEKNGVREFYTEPKFYKFQNRKGLK